MTERVGQQLGNYRLVRHLGRGNFADIYLGTHIHLNTQASPKAAPAIYPAGLTQREVEVLRLVVLGMTNTQIAHKLIVSEKTVATHLTHIFNKTNSENRAAATAFAIRHGLV